MFEASKWPLQSLLEDIDKKKKKNSPLVDIIFICRNMCEGNICNVNCELTPVLLP